MFYVINLLGADDLAQVLAYATSATFTDGNSTAGLTAARSKRNEQASDFDASAPAGLVRRRLGESSKFKMAAIPERVSPLMLSRYESSMSYGLHTDNALMQPGNLRSDLAFTIFLSDPDSYQGGELSIRTGDLERDFKLQAGQMLLYPAAHLHQVKPVIEGARVAVVGWVESIVADAQRRAIVHDLSLAQALLKDGSRPDDVDTLVALARSNLLRLWAGR